MKIFVPHNAHRRVIPAEGDFNNQIDGRITWFCGCWWASFPSHSCHLPLSSGERGRSVRKRGYTWAQQQEHPLPKATLASATLSTQTASQNAFSAGNASVKTTMCELTGHFIHHYGIHTSLLMTNEITLQQMKCSNDSCSWNSLISPYSSLPWNNWLDRLVDWPFKDLIMAPARVQYLVGLGQYPPGCGICSKSASSIWYYFSHSQEPGFIG